MIDRIRPFLDPTKITFARRITHPAKRPRAGGAAPAAVRSGRRERREGFCCGRAKGGPVWDRPAGFHSCARPAKPRPTHVASRQGSSPGPRWAGHKNRRPEWTALVLTRIPFNHILPYLVAYVKRF